MATFHPEQDIFFLIYIFEAVWIFLLPELKYKQQRQKQMNSVNISSIKILVLCQLFLFLFEILRLFSYVTFYDLFPPFVIRWIISFKT